MTKSLCVRLAFTMLVLGATAATSSGAVAPIIDIKGGADTPANGGSNATQGFGFDVSSTTLITGLGIFDVGSDGLTNSHQVGLWTSGGTLLASTTVDNSANAVASTSGFGRWLEMDITPLALTPGAYILGAFYLDNDTNPTEDHIVFSAVASSISGVSYSHWAFIGSPTFDFPSLDLGGDASSASIFGPMAFVGSASSVPEPGTLGFCYGAVGWLVVAHRRRK
jgi:hypothetical protein